MANIEMDAVEILVAVILIFAGLVFITYEATAITPLGARIAELVKSNINAVEGTASFGSGVIEGLTGFEVGGGE